MCDSHRPLEGADSEPRDWKAERAKGRDVPVPPSDYRPNMPLFDEYMAQRSAWLKKAGRAKGNDESRSTPVERMIQEWVRGEVQPHGTDYSAWRREPVPATERMIQEWLPEAVRWPVWRDRAVNGGWDHPRDSEASDGS